MRKLWFHLKCWWHRYDPDFVESVLTADRLDREAGFINVEDLLKHLNEK